MTLNKLFNYGLIVLSIIVIPYLLYQAWLRQPGDPLILGGIILTAASLLFLNAARLQLGGSFSVTPRARNLVTTGLYSRIRHPVYVFGQLLLLGLILSFDLFGLLIPWLVVLFLQIRRARVEERVLGEKFGQEYTDYKRQTWF
jgi:protein-S-isoprenylcysteine O-methyltransferase Ste14